MIATPDRPYDERKKKMKEIKRRKRNELTQLQLQLRVQPEG